MVPRLLKANRFPPGFSITVAVSLNPSTTPVGWLMLRTMIVLPYSAGVWAKKPDITTLRLNWAPGVLVPSLVMTVSFLSRFSALSKEGSRKPDCPAWRGSEVYRLPSNRTVVVPGVVEVWVVSKVWGTRG